MHLQYCNHNILLVINSKGNIRKLYTPFRVLSILPIGDIPANTMVYVEEVLSTPFDELQYVIFGEAFSYKHFKLPLLI